MKNNKVILSTYCTGYNFGSFLQCYALKSFINDNKYDCTIINEHKSYLYKIKLILNGLRNPKMLAKTISSKNQETSLLSDKQISLFKTDIQSLDINFLSYKKAKEESNNALCSVCGSDQIWNTEAIRPNPFYYLLFSNYKKNIAYAPSLGRDYVPTYNKKIIKSYIKNIRFLSTREEANCQLITSLADNRETKFVCDPVFLLSKEEWTSKSITINNQSFKDYIFCYFLDTPSEDLLNEIIGIFNKINKCVLFIGLAFFQYKARFNFQYKFIDIPSLAFPSLIFNCDSIYTDSFHGLAFSIIGKKEVYYFQRNYKAGAKQNVRIKSLINSLGANYENHKITMNENNYKKLDAIIVNSKKYLLSSMEIIKNEQH